MAVRRADLHTHTTASDGTASPAENVRLAKQAGLAAVAITDHDTMAGVAEAVREGEKQGITVVPGVEISTSLNGCDIHILGYYPDMENERWLSRLHDLRRVRERRNEQMAGKLKALGIAVEAAEAERIAAEKRDAPLNGQASTGRPHFAELLVRKGVVRTVREAFDRYLGEGCPAYADLSRITPQEAVLWIREAGGTSVLAHPGLYRNDAVVEQIAACGIDGIEVFHSDHGPEDERKYKTLAQARGLIMTGGSDFHGSKGDSSYHGDLGSVWIEAGVVELLKGKGSNLFRQ
ncbi:PHP domain-containing protein [Paenibacillus protaetiae]|uniref:PHP domain-containing protein n=1 Tax=Paenibacillus protaetiae TaxID=2509456 RepID=A0A4P6ESG8_9BACL|nr:PHP domain-containing protein [Paenibacillus protaetiae]QAY65506.1 PHP domain-containing protein [Paenibacillus protaetiae]